MKRPLIFFLSLVALLSLRVFFIAIVANLDNPISGCTTITAALGEKKFFAGNLDHNPFQRAKNVYLRFHPPSTDGYGYMELGLWDANHTIWSTQGGLNQAGLAWDSNTIQNTPFASFDKPSVEMDNLIDQLMRQVTSVDQAVEFAENYELSFQDFQLDRQLHIADTSGDAVLIGPGPDGELAYTRMDPQYGYLVSTNFNPVNPVRNWTAHLFPDSYDRYLHVTDSLNNLRREDQLTRNFLWSLLERVHLESLASFTLYTYVYDLRSNFIYLHYFSQFGQFARINLAEEMARGEHEIPISQLFPKEIVNQANAHYKFILIRDLIGIIVLLTALVFTFYNLVMLLKAGLRTNTALWRRNTILFGLSWACFFGVAALLLLNLYPSGLIMAGHPLNLYRVIIPLLLIGSGGFLTLSIPVKS